LLLLLLGPRNATTAPAHGCAQVAAAARALLDRPPSQRHSLQEHLAGLGVGYDYLSRAFKRVYGVRPTVYANAMRVERAKRMLLDGLPSAEAAQRSGFNDAGYFSRVFRRLVGVTPGQFASSGRDGNEKGGQA
jgi:AraC-like DNA-binding protein